MFLNRLAPASWLLTFSLLTQQTRSQFVQAPVVQQSTNFNGSLTLTPEQIQAASLSPSEVEAFRTIWEVEYSQYAGGSTLEDPFYIPPRLAANVVPPPGTILKIEDFTQTVNYTLPPNLALSRFLYVSRNVNGTSVPASAYILWPLAPNDFNHAEPNAAPTILWNHLTAGYYGPAAPSKHRNLWAGDNVPFTLALAGYAVIAPDYAGLGVTQDFNGDFLPHQYLAAPAAAADSIFAYHAARAAFSDRLSKSFVGIGHSQGGETTWGLAELLAAEPDLADGYLGSVAMATATNPWGPGVFTTTFVGNGLSTIFPGFELERWLTPLGVARERLLREVNAGMASSVYALSVQVPLLQDGFNETWEAVQFRELTDVGRKAVAGPLLIIQGVGDPAVPLPGTVAAIQNSCILHPENNIELVVYNETGHVPVMDASRVKWLKWIEERFRGEMAQVGTCGQRSDVESFLPLERYTHVWNSFPQWAGAPEYAYEVPLAI